MPTLVPDARCVLSLQQGDDLRRDLLEHRNLFGLQRVNRHRSLTRPHVLTITFNTPPDGEGGDPSTWPRFFVPRGALNSLIDDKRAYRVLRSGTPFVVAFEDANEGHYLLDVVTAALERCRVSALH